MKIAIISDSHDDWNSLVQAIEKANEIGCEVLLFAGDLVAPPGIKFLRDFNGEVKLVWGNNEMARDAIRTLANEEDNIEVAGEFFEGEFDGQKFFMTHFPKYSELAAKTGDFDVCIHGHTHEMRNETIGECRLLNPGSLHLQTEEGGRFMVYDTNSKEISMEGK